MIVVTVAWAVAFYLHVQAYNRYRQDVIEMMIAAGFDEDVVRGTLDHFPFWAWQFGSLIMISGVTIFCVWLNLLVDALLGILRERARAKKRKGKREHLNNLQTRDLMKRLYRFFECEVEVPRIRIGKRQTIETLINEEVLLLAKFLRNECKLWNPRIRKRV